MDFITTNDGSKTLFNEQIGEHYHSMHGAQQESLHVFIQTGLAYYLEQSQQQQASILEIGFGTGLNFLNTSQFALTHQLAIHYIGIEAYPLSEALIGQSGYQQYVDASIWSDFLSQYPLALQESRQLNQQVKLRIHPKKVLDCLLEEQVDIIYFDAFAAIHQPEMWSEETLAHICQFLKPGGVFVTYAITGNLKRTMKSLGFTIQKVPGAPGKREMLRAIKL